MTTNVNMRLSCNEGNVLVSDLPKEAPLGVLLEYLMYAYGSTVVYTRETLHEYFQDLLMIRPTIIHMSPSAIVRLHHVVVTRKTSKIAKWAMAKTIKKKINNLNQKKATNRVCLECMGSLRGGFPKSYKNAKIVLTSGDFLEEEVMAFARSLFSCYVVHLYGTTETLGLAAASPPLAHPSEACVGLPTPSSVIKLEPYKDVPGPMKDLVDETGVILISCPFSATSYQVTVPTNGDPTKPSLKLEKVKRVSGSVKTDDIGTWTKSGELMIIGKLADLLPFGGGGDTGDSGVFSLTRLESVYRTSPFVAQICVLCRKESLVALVYPEKNILKQWAKKNASPETNAKIEKQLAIPKSGIPNDEAFKRKPHVEDIIMPDLKRVGDVYGLKVDLDGIRVSCQPFCMWYGQPRRYLIDHLYDHEIRTSFIN